MNFTNAFIERLARMDPYERGLYLIKNKDEIDFRSLVAQTRLMLKEVKQNIGAITIGTPIPTVLLKQQEKYEDIIDDSVFHTAAQQYPSAVEGPNIYKCELG